MGLVNQVLIPHKDELSEGQFAQQRELLTRKFLQDLIENRLLYQRFIGAIPKEARAKGLPKAWQQVGEIFDREEVPNMIKRAKVSTPAELDAKLREYGHSLAKHRRFYGERELGRWGVMQHIDREPEITYDEMLDYYHEHLAEYDRQPRARWEQLTALRSRFGTPQEADQAVREMANAVFFGTPFQAVARRSSQEFYADKGGQHEWTQQGSLASEPLDAAIFSLEVGKLSPVIEDKQGFHVVRVIEREAGGVLPFEEAQVEIRKLLADQKRNAAFKEYVQRIRTEAYVTTIFDEQEGVAEAPGAPGTSVR